MSQPSPRRRRRCPSQPTPSAELGPERGPAWANRRGRNWARIVSGVFFGINTLDLIVSFTQVHVLASLIGSIVVWLVGLGAIILLFSKESGPYFAKPASPSG